MPIESFQTIYVSRYLIRRFDLQQRQFTNSTGWIGSLMRGLSNYANLRRRSPAAYRDEAPLFFSESSAPAFAPSD
jgi:hypothetical protein